jgi:release factor glutamine methyltransferase
MRARGVNDGPAAGGPTVGDLLADAVLALTSVVPAPLLEAEVLLAFVTGRPRSSILAFPERPGSEAAADELARLIVRRVRGEPLAYLLRTKEFYSLELRVTPAVLIPRPETELLVDEALARLPGGPGRTVLDLGTGSGAIALAVKHERPDCDVTATDVSAAALSVARANAETLGLDVRFVESDWFDALADRRFDLILCNPPYVATGDAALEQLRFEPRLALASGSDGLDALRAVLTAAHAHLAADGWLLLEHGYDQRAALLELAVARGWRQVAALDDLGGQPRLLALAGPAAL